MLLTFTWIFTTLIVICTIEGDVDTIRILLPLVILTLIPINGLQDLRNISRDVLKGAYAAITM
jgi:hypothetical protein